MQERGAALTSLAGLAISENGTGAMAEDYDLRAFESERGDG